MDKTSRKKKKHSDIASYNYKRCPECFTKLPLKATKCPACNQKVQEVGKFGIAKKPVNWIGYITAIGLWVGLGFYVWWAFFKS